MDCFYFGKRLFAEYPTSIPTLEWCHWSSKQVWLGRPAKRAQRRPYLKGLQWLLFVVKFRPPRISSLKIWSLSDYFNDDTEMTIEPEERLPHLYILVGFKFSQSVIICKLWKRIKNFEILKKYLRQFFQWKVRTSREWHRSDCKWSKITCSFNIQ